MSEKLTLEWICKYYKAKIKYEGEVYSVIMIHTLNDMIAIHKKGTGTYQTNTVDISDCKLILRPLSSLTDEERKPITTLKDTDNLFKNIKTLLYYIHGESLIKAVDYLRSINIDIDNLQERGLCKYE